jgi:chromosome segregation ATPase
MLSGKSKIRGRVRVSQLSKFIEQNFKKIDEYEKLIDKLEAEKKGFAVNKNFKEAKRAKDQIEQQQNKKNRLIEEIEESKKSIEQAESRLKKVKRTLNSTIKNQVVCRNNL